ncbi:MAG: methyltransferase family protein [Gemmatimonadota bacterium]
MSPWFRAVRTAVYGSAFLFLWGWLALQSRPFDRALGGALPEGVRTAGLPLMVVGAVLAFACAALFVARGRGTPAPFDPPREFVATGPYRWVRNPMYVGGLSLLAGFSLWHRSLAMLLFTGLVWGLVHLFVVWVEEPGLERRFGEGYRRYRRTVRRWWPRRPRPNIRTNPPQRRAPG